MADTLMQSAHEIAIDAAPYGVLVCDETGRIQFANRQLLAIFGYREDALTGSPIDVLLPERSLTIALADRTAALWKEARSWSMGDARELFGRRKDGSEVPIEVRLTVANNPGYRLVIVSVVDISERYRLQQEIQRAAAERFRFERLVTKLAARFVNIPAREVDAAIIDSQREIVEALGIDRSALWQFTPGDADLRHSHYWARAEFPSPPGEVSARELFPWFFSKIRANEAIWITRLEEVPEPDRGNLGRLGNQATAIIPLTLDNRVVGAISFGSMNRERSWSPELQERLRLVAVVFAQALARKQKQEELSRALAEVEQLRDQLALENVQLRSEVKALKSPQSLAAKSPAIQRVLPQIESVATTDATVLILGETGSGKEVLAQAIHDASARRDRPMVRVNCAAIPVALIESELFGRERGAYTGALSKQIGRFELANGSTIFLDEVGDLPMEAQAKLLRIIQDRVLERLGSVKPIKVDVRIIAATNKDLGRAVAERGFREDLFYRLNVFPITVPPLRDRQEDIPLLVWMFIEEFSKAFNKKIDSISKGSMAALQKYAWPGNVRELRNVIERAVIVSKGARLMVELPSARSDSFQDDFALARVEADHIRAILTTSGWRVRGKGGAAELLKMKPTTLESRMAKLGIQRPHRRVS